MASTKEKITVPKEEKARQVAISTLKLIDQFGLEAVTHARVARAAKVSRPWLYKYIGSKRESLIEFAIDQFGKEFVRLEQPLDAVDLKSFNKEIADGAIRVMQKVHTVPWLISIYAKYAAANNALGERIRHVESLYVNRLAQKIQEIFKYDKKKSLILSELLAATRMGVVLRYLRYNPKYRPEPEVIQEHMLLMVKLLASK